MSLLRGWPAVWAFAQMAGLLAYLAWIVFGPMDLLNLRRRK